MKFTEPSLLLWDDRVDDALVEQFFVETEAQIEALEEAVGLLDTDPQAAMRRIEGVAQTLKNSSQTLGIEPLRALAGLLKQGSGLAGQSANAALLASLRSAVGLLGRLFAAVQGLNDPPGDYSSIMQGLADVIAAAPALLDPLQPQRTMPAFIRPNCVCRRSGSIN